MASFDCTSLDKYSFCPLARGGARLEVPKGAPEQYPQEVCMQTIPPRGILQ